MVAVGSWAAWMIAGDVRANKGDLNNVCIQGSKMTDFAVTYNPRDRVRTGPLYFPLPLAKGPTAPTPMANGGKHRSLLVLYRAPIE